jgi:hypothetical protein
MSGFAEALFGVWSFDRTALVCTLALQPDWRYAQDWNQGSVVQNGFWRVEFVGPQAFLVLTLAQATPPTDFGLFGWQPALIGRQTVFAVQSLYGGHLVLFGASLTMTTRYSAAPAAPAVTAPAAPAAGAPAAGAPAAAQSAPSQTDQLRAIYQSIHDEDEKTKASIEAMYAKQAQNEAAAQKAAMDSLSGAIHDGSVKMTSMAAVPGISFTPPRPIYIPPRR